MSCGVVPAPPPPLSCTAHNTRPTTAGSEPHPGRMEALGARGLGVRRKSPELPPAGTGGCWAAPARARRARALALREGRRLDATRTAGTAAACAAAKAVIGANPSGSAKRGRN